MMQHAPPLHPRGASAPAPRPLRARLAAYPPWSWRADSAVPAFDDVHAMIIFDGVCVVCSRFARFVAARDQARRFRLVAAQSTLGQVLMQHYKFDAVDFESNLLIDGGCAFGKTEAVAGILRQLGWPWRCAANLILLLPGPLRDWSYDRIARNRYAVFGRYPSGVVAGPDWADRMLDVDKGQAR
jgi:predicted DCC family thiol-disulfide oxidoreductase YuxK